MPKILPSHTHYLPYRSPLAARSLSAGGDGVDAGAADPERLGHLGGAHGGAAMLGTAAARLPARP